MLHHGHIYSGCARGRNEETCRNGVRHSAQNLRRETSKRVIYKDVIAVTLATAITLAIYYVACMAVIALLAKLGGIL